MDALKSNLIQGLLRLLSWLPLGLARKLGSVVGRVLWLANDRSRKVTQRNIAAVYSELSAQEQEALSRKSLISMGQTITEMGHVWLRPWPYVESIIQGVEGVEQIIEAQQQGRGVIILGPHLGNWEVLGLHLGGLAETVALYEPPKLEQLGKMIESSRQRSGATLVPTTARGLATLTRAVKRGCITGILPDQVPDDMNSGINSEFMGIPCFTGTLACNLLQRTDALALFGFARRVEGGFVVHYLPADEEIYSDDIAVSVGALNRGVERCVEHCVEQYQWEYKRFRSMPKNELDFYKR